MNNQPFLKQALGEAAGTAEYLQAYMGRVSQMVLAIDSVRLTAVVDAVEEIIAHDRAIFLMGNGGSSASAAHFVNDLGPNSLVADAPGVRVFNLTDNVASLSAVANDSGYESVFHLQLKTWLRPGDLVMGFSVSGNSPNVLKAAAFASENGCRVIGFTGFDGGKLGAFSDIHVNFPATCDEYGPVEDMFSVVGHAISGLITMRRGRWLHH
jgi:D-sedoheptulose 7-phosphate isomerase